MTRSTKFLREEVGLSQPRRLLQAGFSSLSGSTGQKWLLALADQAVVSGAGFLAGVIIARVGGKEQFGLYILGLTIVGLLMELQNVLVWSPYTFFSPRLSGSALDLYTGSTFIHQWTFSAGGILALAAAGVCLSRGVGPLGLETVVWILVFSSSLLLFREYLRRVCFAGLRMKAALVLDLWVAALQSAVLLFLAYRGKLAAASALGVMGFACGLVGLSWLIWNRRAFKFSFTRVSSELRQNWSFGKWLLADNLAFFMSCELYPWVLSAVYDTAAVGILAACQGVVALMSPFLQGCLNFLPPKTAQVFAQDGLEGLRSLVVKGTLVIGGFIGTFCGAIIIWGDQLAGFIYGPQYVGHGWVISILALNILAYALSLAMGYGLWALGRVDLNFKINLLRMGVTFTLGFWLVKTYGPIGVAWGLLLGSLVAGVFRYFVFIKLFYLLPHK